ncbi:nitrate- and nitrite sensing domain-containing protein [Microtetraspora sp. NBRC 13810]|uniref:sensor histidine kinase n=1 Tax=Microtetraspora sp. NBRC 13810 TaxID=3030990 RepID=UPI002553031A|nr:nitrate- and nitrite sensing domain-containing protein [Microtetraspora sp. NBRC 13810]
MRRASTPADRENRGLAVALQANAPDAEQGATSDAADGTREKRRGGGLSLRNWRVRTRLVALVLVPTLTGVAFGTVQIVSSLDTAAEYERTGEMATFASTLSALAHEVELERDLSARYVAEGRSVEKTRTAVESQRRAVNDALGGVRSGIDAAELVSGETGGQRARDEIARVRSRLGELPGIRAAVTDTELLPPPVIDRYSNLITDLLAVHDDVGQGVDDDTLSASVSAFGAIARAKEHASRERATLAVALPARAFTSGLFDDFVAARAERNSEIAVFKSEAALPQRQFYDDTVSGQLVDRAEQIRLRALVAASGQLARGGPSVLQPQQLDRWFESSTDTIDRMRQVEERLASSIVTTSHRLRDEERQSAVTISVIVAVLLLAVLLITLVMARSLVSPLRRLRTEALSIAGQRLPETVQSLRDSGDMTPVEIEPIGVSSHDEIGEVARAFDEVHREAVRLAGQEATLRSNVNAMFVNLSRRSQTLVERQLSLIESLEQGEQDEERLGNLFRLDHLATRMRRNSENLLVLAGQEPARRWSQPVPLIDVVRASLSEVENYERVAVSCPPGPAVAGTSVNDVVHLIAELVENALSFSPRETKVTVSSNRIDGGGVMVSVSDVGIGMTAEELAGANWRLANPPVVDVSVSRRMGLFVVGRLALRHGIRVQLRQQDSGGLTAMVLLPTTLLSAPDPRTQAPPGYGTPFDPSFGDPSFGDPMFGRQPVMAAPSPYETPGRPGTSLFDSPPSQGASMFDGGAGQTGPLFGGAPPADSFGGHRNGRPYGENSGDMSWPDPVAPPGGWTDNSLVGDSGSWSMRSMPSMPSMPPGSPMSSMTSTPSMPSIPTPPPSMPPSAPPSMSSMPADPLASFGGPETGPLRRFGMGGEPDATGPLPVVHNSVADAEEDYLPIFAAVESDWFRRAEPAARPESPPVAEQAREPLPTRESRAPESRRWSSPSDEGWQAARAASEPAKGGITQAGLPKRVPKANLVPGSAAPSAAPSPTPPPRPTISPDAVRSRLASFQHGVRQGRAVARGEVEDGAYPDFTRNFDTQGEVP